MKRPTFLGSILCVLLAFVAISDARTSLQQQDPKPAQATTQDPKIQTSTAAEVTKTETTANQPADTRPVATEAKPASEPAPVAAKPAEIIVIAAEKYTATAYSLRGRTASGKLVTRGIIAADPRVLPIGTRVRVDAGPWSGEYLVADTGGAVKGRHIDIWIPTAGEAMRFGRRLVKLTVLELGGRRRKTLVAPSLLPVTTKTVSIDTQSSKQEK
jgi:3D (Asp-Asp-Asp) domain-containing protein